MYINHFADSKLLFAIPVHVNQKSDMTKFINAVSKREREGRHLSSQLEEEGEQRETRESHEHFA
jgi:hypothetical protein